VRSATTRSAPYPPPTPPQSSTNKDEPRRIFIDDDVYENPAYEPASDIRRREYLEEPEKKQSLLDRFKRKFVPEENEEDLSIPTFIRRRSK
jgi:hypothetical protein